MRNVGQRGHVIRGEGAVYYEGGRNRMTIQLNCLIIRGRNEACGALGLCYEVRRSSILKVAKRG
jgi:hypothetical protein